MSVSRADRGPNGLLVTAVKGPARRAGLLAGDRVVLVSGSAPVDVLDLDWAAADGAFEVVVERGGRRLSRDVAQGRGEWHGITLEHGLGDTVRRCVNDCSFCFVDQMPAGLRPSLLVKDDDYRLSFLRGNFITLSNLDERDVERIMRMRLSPLYVSLHAWDDHIRSALMGPATVRTRDQLLRLASAGIRMHVQVVLCPERNDGQVLRETVEHLAAVNTIEDVGVVPVSLTTEDPLRRVGATDAEAAVELIETLQPGLRAQIGRSFVHAADEMYLLAGRRPPAADAPLQYENGIGIAATFLEEAHTLASASNEWTDLSPLRLLCGTLARPVVEEACRLLGRSRPFPVENRLFGSHVTVAGLLSGADVLRALEEQPLRESEYLLAPRSFLPAALERTIDDVTVVTLREACHSRLVLGDGLGDAFARLPGS